MGTGGKTAVEVFGFLVGVLAVICLGASGMAFVNIFAGFADGSSSSYVLIAIGALVLSVALGLLAGTLLSWADPERKGRGGKGTS